MSGQRRVRRRWIAAVGAAGILLIGAALVPFPAPAWGGDIGRAAESRLGIRFNAARTTFSLTRGLTLHDVSTRVSTNGLELSARIERVVAAHTLSLGQPLRIEALRVIRPRVTVVVGERPANAVPSPPPPAPATTEEAAPRAEPGTTDALPIAFGSTTGVQVDVTLADLEVRSPAANAFPFRAAGTDVRLEGVSHDGSTSSLLHAVVGSGVLTIRELWIGPLVVVDAASPVTLGDGHILLPELTFWCGGRHFLLRDVDIDFTNDPYALVTPGTIHERRRPDRAAPAEWVSVGPLSELDGLCGR